MRYRLALALSFAAVWADGRAEAGKLLPEKGVFLVAKPSIESGPFHRSVVLVLSHGPLGTLGVIVNRVTSVSVDEVLSELPPDLVEEAKTHDLYFGGPVELEGLLFVYRSDQAADAESRVSPVMEDVYYSGNRELLDNLLKENTPPERLHLFLGHSGWAPGQLDKELLRGDWDVVRADAFSVFVKDPKTLWEELSKDQRVIAGRRERLQHFTTYVAPEGSPRAPRPSEAKAPQR